MVCVCLLEWLFETYNFNLEDMCIGLGVIEREGFVCVYVRVCTSGEGWRGGEGVAWSVSVGRRGDAGRRHPAHSLARLQHKSSCNNAASTRGGRFSALAQSSNFLLHTEGVFAGGQEGRLSAAHTNRAKSHTAATRHCTSSHYPCIWSGGYATKTQTGEHWGFGTYSVTRQQRVPW